MNMESENPIVRTDQKLYKRTFEQNLPEIEFGYSKKTSYRKWIRTQSVCSCQHYEPRVYKLSHQSSKTSKFPPKRLKCLIVCIRQF